MTTDTQSPIRYARLVRGQKYVLRRQIFEAGQVYKITPAIEGHLRRYAIDVVTVQGGGQGRTSETRQKFEFSDTPFDIVADEPEPQVQTASRRRVR